MLENMGLLKRLKRVFKDDEKPRERFQDELLSTDIIKIKAPELSDTIKSWEQQVSLLQTHPLSQARVVNTQILSSLTDILGGLDNKLASLSKLDDILTLLKAQEVSEIEKNSLGAIDRVLKKVRHITIKDRIMIDLLEKNPILSAEEVAAELNVTRSTVSYRLNKLYSMGVLDKEVSGRKILFKISSTSDI
ncbi:MAG: winged helix-turn-helix transcriptional regulator [Nanoarchaeota archaeon]|nr:winged helix-turn-helix transcriptional regulator [Nanoarchaeota archaeon]